jgi:hypothetical protein
MRQFKIWHPGWSADGKSEEAKFLGLYPGDSPEEAIANAEAEVYMLDIGPLFTVKRECEAHIKRAASGDFDCVEVSLYGLDPEAC